MDSSVESRQSRRSTRLTSSLSEKPTQKTQVKRPKAVAPHANKFDGQEKRFEVVSEDPNVPHVLVTRHTIEQICGKESNMRDIILTGM